MVRGVVFPSQRAVAAAFGVSEATVSVMVAKGRADDIGRGSGSAHGRGGGRCPVMIRGSAYPSITAAARALGVATRTVALALDSGRVDRVGLGRWPQ
jgi:hypothetical protein